MPLWCMISELSHSTGVSFSRPRFPFETGPVFVVAVVVARCGNADPMNSILAGGLGFELALRPAVGARLRFLGATTSPLLKLNQSSND